MPRSGSQDPADAARLAAGAVLASIGGLAEAKRTGRVHRLPGVHTHGFAPDREATIRTAVRAFTLSVVELAGAPTPTP